MNELTVIFKAFVKASKPSLLPQSLIERFLMAATRTLSFEEAKEKYLAEHGVPCERCKMLQEKADKIYQEP